MCDNKDCNEKVYIVYDGISLCNKHYNMAVNETFQQVINKTIKTDVVL